MARAPDGMPAHLTRGPVIVKAWAPWCSSCRALGPYVRHAATTSGVPVVDLQVDADPALVKALAVRSVPTLIGLRDGIEVGRLVGVQTPDTVEALFATTDAGTGTISDQTPTSLVVVRAATGSVLAGAGLVLNTVVLVAIGAALFLWAFVGLIRRST